MERVDVDRALNETKETRMMWHQSQQHPNSPPFAGGVLTDWPSVAVDGFAILNHEMQLIQAYRASQREERK